MAKEWIGARPLAEVLEKLSAAGVSAAPIYSNKQMIEDPHFIERGAVTSVPDPDFGSVKMPGVVPRFSETPGSIRSTGPAMGAHNAEVFGGWLGLDETEQARLLEQGVI